LSVEGGGLGEEQEQEKSEDRNPKTERNPRSEEAIAKPKNTAIFLNEFHRSRIRSA
jgi:hypothetical protein